MHFREGLAGGTGFLWEINWTEGTIQITADGGLPGIYPLTVTGARGQRGLAELAIPAACTERWSAITGLAGGPAYNVARSYAAFADDRRKRHPRSP